jgi:hypothetical protein
MFISNFLMICQRTTGYKTHNTQRHNNNTKIHRETTDLLLADDN